MQESVKNNLASDMEEGNSFIILYYISTSMVNSEANNLGDGRVVCDKLYEHIYDDRLWLREKGEKKMCNCPVAACGEQCFSATATVFYRAYYSRW